MLTVTSLLSRCRGAGTGAGQQMSEDTTGSAPNHPLLPSAQPTLAFWPQNTATELPGPAPRRQLSYKRAGQLATLSRAVKSRGCGLPQCLVVGEDTGQRVGGQQLSGCLQSKEGSGSGRAGSAFGGLGTKHYEQRSVFWSVPSCHVRWRGTGSGSKGGKQRESLWVVEDTKPHEPSGLCPGL